MYKKNFVKKSKIFLKSSRILEKARNARASALKFTGKTQYTSVRVLVCSNARGAQTKLGAVYTLQPSLKMKVFHMKAEPISTR